MLTITSCEFVIANGKANPYEGFLFDTDEESCYLLLSTVDGSLVEQLHQIYLHVVKDLHKYYMFNILFEDVCDNEEYIIFDGETIPFSKLSYIFED